MAVGILENTVVSSGYYVNRKYAARQTRETFAIDTDVSESKVSGRSRSVSTYTEESFDVSFARISSHGSYTREKLAESGTDAEFKVKLTAGYAENSTEEKPVIRVTANDGIEEREYDVNIFEVDPKNASELELYALSYYVDEIGMAKRNGITDLFGGITALERNLHPEQIARNMDEFAEKKSDHLSALIDDSFEYNRASIYSKAVECRQLGGFLQHTQLLGLADVDERIKNATVMTEGVSYKIPEIDLSYGMSSEEWQAWDDAMTAAGIFDEYGRAGSNSVMLNDGNIDFGILKRIREWVKRDPKDGVLNAAREALKELNQYADSRTKGVNAPAETAEIEQQRKFLTSFINNLEALKTSKAEAASKTEKISKAENISLKEMLKEKYPNLVYNVGDGSSSFWRTRNDFPFEYLFRESEDSGRMLENWKPNGANPKYQRYIAAAPGSKAVLIHPKAQERMENDPEFAKEVMDRIEAWWKYDIARNEAIAPGFTAGMSQAIAIGEDGEITNVLSCGGGDSISHNRSRNGDEEEYDWWAERMARHAMYMQLWLTGKADFSGLSSILGAGDFGASGGDMGMGGFLNPQLAQVAENEIHDMIDNGNLREILGDTVCGDSTDEIISHTWGEIEQGRKLWRALSGYTNI